MKIGLTCFHISYPGEFIKRFYISVTVAVCCSYSYCRKSQTNEVNAATIAVALQYDCCEPFSKTEVIFTNSLKH